MHAAPRQRPQFERAPQTAPSQQGKRSRHRPGGHAAGTRAESPGGRWNARSGFPRALAVSPSNGSRSINPARTAALKNCRARPTRRGTVPFPAGPAAKGCGRKRSVSAGV